MHLALGVLYVTVLALSTGTLRGGSVSYEQVAEGARVVFGVIGMVAAIRAARAPALLPRLRQAWRAVTVSLAVLILSPLLVAGLRAAGIVAADDVTHVAFVAALLVALQRFPLAATNSRERWKAALDAGTVLTGGMVLLWYVSFGPYVDAHGLSLAVVVAAGFYPIVDLALLFVVARAMLRGSDPSATRPLRLLAAGTLVLFAGDGVHGYLHGHGQISMHSPWQFVCWITTDALLAAAAAEQCRAISAGRREARGDLGASRHLPLAAVAMAHALMLTAALQEENLYPWGGLAIGATVLSALVLWRQMLVQRESDERALTDGLTGLANRSRFRATSYRNLARNARAGRWSAVLVIDMNGFKEVNDTLGHKSGDLVLVEFAEVLKQCVPAPGLPCRMGGDEFSVVLTDLDYPEQAYDVAGRIAAAMGPVAIDNKLIPLAASIGVAVSAPGELTHDEIVHRADLAMYRAKALGPQTRWAIWQESLEPQPAAAA
ncbi:GGDEF domain-containing protein [Actinoplanes sp. L3-i22]|uniref:GGDEF domain-containing protein n=1 Tax=Actinoplanes sp. L3-i22 TaxID=2836373 RepID=UPI0021027094|nr:GGDEF domain-containing protein [Actinoplanes sp. L3-i22]